jgi:hypothetical protein
MINPNYDNPKLLLLYGIYSECPSNWKTYGTIFDVQGSVLHRECIYKYNQQVATLYNSFISAKCSTCFRRFLHTSSGAQNLYIQHLVFIKQLLITFAVVEKFPKMLYMFHAVPPPIIRSSKTVHTAFGIY